MKILFLDVDGVLNCEGTTERFKGCLGIEPAKVTMVNRIVNETGCNVVVSSSWRHDHDSFMHITANIKHVIGATRTLKGIRGDEVEDFMQRKPYQGSRYAILDDDADFHPDQPLFRTTFKTGLTPEIAQQVIDHLNAGDVDVRA